MVPAEGLRFVEVGSFDLKGIARPVTLHQVLRDGGRPMPEVLLVGADRGDRSTDTLGVSVGGAYLKRIA